MGVWNLLFGLLAPAPFESATDWRGDFAVACSAFSVDGTRLATAGQELAIWDVSNQTRIFTLPLTRPDHTRRTIAWSPDGNLAVLDEAGMRLMILDGNDDFKVTKVLGFDKSGPVADFSFNGSGASLLVAFARSANEQHNAMLFDTRDWNKTPLHTGLSNEAVAWIGSDIVVAGNQLAPGNHFSYTRFDPRDPGQRRIIRVTPQPAQHIRMTVCQARNLIILSSHGQDGQDITRLRIIHANATTTLRVLDIPGFPGRSMTFSGGWLVLFLTRDGQQVIKLLDAETGLFQRKTFNCRRASSLCASIDGTQIAVAHQRHVFTYRLRNAAPENSKKESTPD